jgi:DMSO/TMAO reductase YedYZ molybdopterin-dependent catalytic subunit
MNREEPPMALLNCLRALVAFVAVCVCAIASAQPMPSQTAVPPVTGSLVVTGNVAQPLTLSVADLRRFDAREFDYTPQPMADHKAAAESPRHYKGVLLRDVLAAAKPSESEPRQLRRSFVVATASDKYTVVFSWAELFVSPTGDSAYLVYERDGKPLPADEGPMALIVPSDTRPVRHVKWLQALELRAE